MYRNICYKQKTPETDFYKTDREERSYKLSWCCTYPITIVAYDLDLTSITTDTKFPAMTAHFDESFDHVIDSSIEEQRYNNVFEAFGIENPNAVADVSTSIVSDDRPMDIVYLLDVSSSMGEARRAAMKAMRKSFDDLLSKGFRICIAAYSDYCDRTCFVSFPFRTSSSDLTRDISSVTMQGGGDLPEATLGGLVRLTPGVRGAPDWLPDRRRLIVIITDAPPHVKGMYRSDADNVAMEYQVIRSLGQVPDAIAIAKKLDSEGVKVSTIAVRNMYNIYGAFAEITGAPGVFVTARSDEKTILEHINMTIGLVSGDISEQDLPDAATLAKLGPEDASVVLNATKVDSTVIEALSSNDRVVHLHGDDLIDESSKKFGVVRKDGHVRKGMSLDAEVSSLMESLPSIAERVSEVHSKYAVECEGVREDILFMSFGELLEAFMDRMADAIESDDYDAAIMAIASIVPTKWYTGPLPEEGDDFNFQVLWTLMVNETADGLLTNTETLKDMRVVSRGGYDLPEISKGSLVRARDMISRTDTVTGGVPCTFGHEFVAKLFDAIGLRMMNTIASYSVSEYAYPTPYAFLGSACSVLLAALNNNKKAAIADMLHTVTACSMRAGASIRRAFVDYSNGIGTIAAVASEIAIQSDCHPTMIVYTLANSAIEDTPAWREIVALCIGEVFSRFLRYVPSIEKTPEAAYGCLVEPNIPDATSEIFVTMVEHPIENGTVDFDSIRFRGTLSVAAEKAVRIVGNLLESMGLDKTRFVSGRLVQSRILEAVALGDAKSRAKMQNDRPKSVLADVSDEDELEAIVVRNVASRRYRREIERLGEMRVQRVKDNIVVPAIVKAMAEGKKTLVKVLNAIYVHTAFSSIDVVPTASIVESVLNGLGRTDVPVENMLVLLTGKNSDRSSVWSFNESFDRKLIDSPAVVSMTTEDDRSVMKSMFPLGHVTIPGSENNSRRWHEFMLEACKTNLFVEEGGEITITASDAESIQTGSKTIPAVNFIVNHGPVVVRNDYGRYRLVSFNSNPNHGKGSFKSGYI